jgi:hypothetical protein
MGILSWLQNIINRCHMNRKVLKSGKITEKHVFCNLFVMFFQKNQSFLLENRKMYLLLNRQIEINNKLKSI